MTLSDLIKVMDDDVKIAVYNRHKMVCEGQIADLLAYGWVTENHMGMIVTDVYFSTIYNAISITVE